MNFEKLDTIYPKCDIIGKSTDCYGNIKWLILYMNYYLIIDDNVSSIAVIDKEVGHDKAMTVLKVI